MAERMLHRAEPNPKLEALLEKAKSYKMSPEEQRAQRRSWVLGELMLEHPEMTRDEALARVLRAEDRV